MNPDPKHRVYRRADIPKITNRWLERLMIAVMFACCLVPLSFMYNYYDGRVPITNRKRFLIIPFWLDSLVGTYSLTALGIGSEDDDAENDTDNTNSKSPYDAHSRPNSGAILAKTDDRVVHITNIFMRILIANQLVDTSLKEYINVNDINEQIESIEENAHSSLHKYQQFDWRINVVDRIGVINAMCAPGGKMVMFTGILKEVVSNDDECAAIICHEIGHAICRHGIEQMQWRLFFVACAFVALGSLGIDLSWIQEYLVNIAIKVVLQLPMSRMAELEADEVAIYLMQHAGYDVQALVSVMTKLGELEERIGHVPEVLSTHPLTDDRVQVLKDKIAALNE